MNTIKHMVAEALVQAWRGFFWGAGFILAAALVVAVADAAGPSWW